MSLQGGGKPDIKHRIHVIIFNLSYHSGPVFSENMNKKQSAMRFHPILSVAPRNVTFRNNYIRLRPSAHTGFRLFFHNIETRLRRALH